MRLWFISQRQNERLSFMPRQTAALLFITDLLFACLALWSGCFCNPAQACAEGTASAQGETQTWFVREDGGDRKQCTGKTDAAYAGKGAGQPCAFKHPYFLFTTDRY